MNKPETTIPIIIDKKTKSYPITIGFDVYLQLPKYINNKQRAFIITDSNVHPLYCNKITSILNQETIEFHEHIVPAGEASKNIEQLQHIWKFLLQNNIERNDIIIALGGGVIGDMAGFAAATIVRGINFIQLPTTLLAQVDSSVGGKTGIDFAQTKNMVGSFHQPIAVLAEISTLKTLPNRELLSGYAECLKHGLIRDKNYWETFSTTPPNQLNEEQLFNLVKRSCEIKAAIVEEDEHEKKGVRQLLNLGHTIGHALESSTNFSHYTHGEAIAIGTVVTAWISHLSGLISENDVQSIITGFQNVGLPTTSTHADPATILPLLKTDKKVSQGQVHWTLLKSIGTAISNQLVNDNIIIESLNKISYIS
ncbi:MAG: 3-dehydroquinate synthase [bacterium]